MAREAALTLLLMLVYACATDTHADTRVRTALDVLAQVIDPAYSVAMDGCIARQEIATAEAESGLVTLEHAQATIAQVRVRCERVRDGFETIRIHHDQAVRSVEAGKLDQAELLLEQIRADWSALRVGGDT
jgi:tRNA A37 methylthiotransferase MiaB